MKAHFLQAEVPLTKTFKLVDGTLEKVGHPRVVEYVSHEEAWATIEDLYALLTKHADLGHCFLKGNLNRQLVNESRAGTTDANAPTRLAVLDLDGVKGVKNVDGLLRMLDAADVDHVVQYSSSMGVVPDRGLSAHVFMLLAREYPPALLKQWLMHLNLTVPVLRNNLGMTRTNNALRWTLDVTTCQNDKLIYIAPPLLGDGVEDGFVGDRIQLVRRKKRSFELPDKLPSAEANKVAAEAALNELREKAGLPRRAKVSYKTSGPIEYMAKPDQAIVTGIKRERGFVYLNINGGDSWGYYHPDTNPEFIHNFKGEPVFRTKDLVPDYWHDVRKTSFEARKVQTGLVYLAFRDFRTAAYWNGTWDPEAKDLRIAEARGKEQLADFLKQHGQPVGDFVEDWDVRFAPNDPEIVNVEAKTVNLFQPSEYMAAEHEPVKEVPPAIRRLVLHAVGGDEEMLEHMMNTLAVIFQHRCRTETAWVLHGIEGTGKGLFLNKVLRPIFKYVTSKRMRELDSQFNGYMERCLILWLDEMQLSALNNAADVVESDIKNYIVEPIISIRRMHMMPYEAPNHMNLIIPGNKDDVMVISPTDRRFNVAPYQATKFETSDEELAQVEEELMGFAGYLATRRADRQVARTPRNNAAKQRMAHISLSSVDVVARAVLSGDLQFLWEQRPVGHLTSGNSARDILAGAYLRLLEEVARGGKGVLLREDLHVIMEYAVGGMPATPHKFSSLLKHHGIILEPTSVGGKSARGIKVAWRAGDGLKREMLGK